MRNEITARVCSIASLLIALVAGFAPSVSLAQSPRSAATRYFEFGPADIECDPESASARECYMPSVDLSAPPPRCPTLPLRPFCEIGQPKEWTASEIETIEHAFDRIDSPHVRQFLITVGNGRRIPLRRMRAEVIVEADGSIHVPPFLAIAAHLPALRKLLVFDHYFERIAAFRSERGSRELPRDASRMLIHEPAHVFSAYRTNSDLTRDCGFIAAIGDDDRTHGSFAELGNEARRFFLETIAPLRERGRVEESERLNREFGRARGFPSAYALMNRDEAFAEVVSDLLLEPGAEAWLRPAIVRWFRERVFVARPRPAVECPIRSM